jgi:glycosyltransferase involved in cell wall biosynthesis
MIDAARVRTTGVALLASRLCILGDDPCGGSEVVLWEDARILESAGIPVRVYARAALNGSPVHTIPFRTGTAQLNTIEYIRGLLRKEPQALIIAYNEPALAGYAPDRVIVRFDWTTPLPRYWSWPPWLSRFQRARYLFPSESERQIFIGQHARIPEQQTVVIPNAVDLEVFRPAKHTPRNPNTPLRVGFAGQWTRRKGIEELLQSWQRVNSTLPTCELHIAGGPSVWKNVSKVAGARGVEHRISQMEDASIRWVGSLPRSEMPRFWSSLDVAIVPSLYEPFGLVALEALACGVPVIASAVGGLKEIVLDGQCGLLVPPGDAAALARALCVLLADEPLRARLSASARLRAQHFTLQGRSRQLLSLVLKRKEKDKDKVA